MAKKVYLIAVEIEGNGTVGFTTNDIALEFDSWCAHFEARQELGLDPDGKGCTVYGSIEDLTLDIMDGVVTNFAIDTPTEKV